MTFIVSGKVGLGSDTTAPSARLLLGRFRYSPGVRRKTSCTNTDVIRCHGRSPYSLTEALGARQLTGTPTPPRSAGRLMPRCRRPSRGRCHQQLGPTFRGASAGSPRRSSRRNAYSLIPGCSKSAADVWHPPVAAASRVNADGEQRQRARKCASKTAGTRSSPCWPTTLRAFPAAQRRGSPTTKPRTSLRALWRS